MTNEKDLLAKLEAVLKINDMLVSENEKQKQMIESIRSNGHRNVAVGCNAVYGITPKHLMEKLKLICSMVMLPVLQTMISRRF